MIQYNLNYIKNKREIHIIGKLVGSLEIWVLFKLKSAMNADKDIFEDGVQVKLYFFIYTN